MPSSAPGVGRAGVSTGLGEHSQRLLPGDGSACDSSEKAAVVRNKRQEFIVHDLEATRLGHDNVLYDHLAKGMSFF